MIEYILTVVLLAVVWLVVVCVIRPLKKYRSYRQQFQSKGYKVWAIPFRPFYIPFLGLLQKSKNEGDALKFIKTQYSKYDVVVTNSLNKIIIDLTNPELIKDFYSTEHLFMYPKLEVSVKPIKRTMGEGIPFSEGEVWKRKRRIVNKVFNFDLIKSLTGKVSDLCDKAIIEVEKTAKKPEQGVVQYNILDLTVRMFSGVITECFLGGATDQYLEGKPVSLFMTELINNATRFAGEPLPLLLGEKFLNSGIRSKDRDVNRRLAIFRKWGKQFVSSKVKKAKQRINEMAQKRQPNDIIEALLMDNLFSQNKGESGQESGYSEDQIFQQFSTFFVAGTDTTSHYVRMMIYMIAKNPEVELKLRQQISKYMEDDDYSHENLKNFKYVDWIQKQTTRYYGPITGIFIREAAQDNYIKGIPIQKGTFVSVQHMGNHYSQKYFKDPLEFRPQRWQSQCQDLPAFVLGGFSFGGRTCIGKHLVMVQSKIALIKFMKRYKKITLPKQDFKMVLQFVYTPEEFDTRLEIASD